MFFRGFNSLVLAFIASLFPSCTCVMHVQAEQSVFHGAPKARLWLQDESLATRKSHPVGWKEYPIQEYGFHGGLTFVTTSAMTSSGFYFEDQAILEVDGRAVFLSFQASEDQAASYQTLGGEVVAFAQRCSTRVDRNQRGALVLSFEDDGAVHVTMRFEFRIEDLEPFMESFDGVARRHSLPIDLAR